MASKSKLIINCGTTYLTAGLFSYDSKKLVLEKFYAEELVYDYSDQSQWLPALTSALKKMNLSGKAVVIAPASIILPKTIQVPHVTGDRQKEVIGFEAAKNIPYDLSEVTWDYQVISDDGVETEVLLVSMRKSAANDFCDAISQAGVVPESLEASSVLDYNTWKLFSLPENAIMLNVGARTTNMIISRDEGLFVRSIPIGGNSLTQAIADSLGKNFQQTEGIKTTFYSNEANYNSSDAAADIFKNNEKAVIKRISMEIKRSILAYRRKVKDPVSKIFLTGRASLLPDFSQILCEDQGVSVDYLNPLENLAISPKVDGNILNANAAALSELIGEASRLVLGEKAVGVNLLPPEIGAHLAFEAKRPLLMVSALILACSTILPFVYINNAISARKSLTKELNKAVPTMNERIEQVAANKEKVDKLIAKIGDLEGLANTKSNWMNFFVDLEKRIVDAKDVWLEGLNVVRTAAVKDLKGNIRKKAEYKLEVTGRLLLRDVDPKDPSRYDSAAATKRITDLLKTFKNSDFITDYLNVKTDPTNPRVLKFTFTLLVNEKKPI